MTRLSRTGNPIPCVKVWIMFRNRVGGADAYLHTRIHTSHTSTRILGSTAHTFDFPSWSRLDPNRMFAFGAKKERTFLYTRNERGGAEREFSIITRSWTYMKVLSFNCQRTGKPRSKANIRHLKCCFTCAPNGVVSGERAGTFIRNSSVFILSGPTIGGSENDIRTTT